MPSNAACKKRVSSLLALALAIILAVALAGCSSSSTEEGSVYVVTSISVYDDDGDLEYTETYEIDENGSYVGQTRTYSDDSAEEDETTYTFEVDEDGFYTACSYTTYDDDEEEYIDVTEERSVSKTNSAGQPTKIEYSVYHDGELYDEGVIVYTYNDDGALETISFSEDAEDPYYEFDENGCVTTVSDDALYIYSEDDDGLVESCTQYDDEGETGYTFEYIYDDDGNVSKVKVVYDNETYRTYEITYEEVEEPSMAARLESEERTYMVALMPVVL